MRRSLLRWSWVLGSLGGLVLLTTAAQADAVVSPGAFTTAMLGAIGLAILGALRAGYNKASKALDQFGDVLTALYGPKDPAGHHMGGGMVDTVNRVAVMVERIPAIEHKVDAAADQAAAAANTAHTAQELARQAMERQTTERTRSTDR